MNGLPTIRTLLAGYYLGRRVRDGDVLAAGHPLASPSLAWEGVRATDAELLEIEREIEARTGEVVEGPRGASVPRHRALVVFNVCREG